ncbi:hypothetical protein HJFPF1_04155 [Paramyrothecium foliicola]|nr:hypothetical protein HJFPF1_04155 [Paramyrothecium foliicola]
MPTCLCSNVRKVADDFDEASARRLLPSLNQHLKDIHSLFAKSKHVARDANYLISPNNQRTMKILNLRAVEVSRVDQLCERLETDIDAFWSHSNDPINAELCRRIACITIFLISKLDTKSPLPVEIDNYTKGSNPTELRYAGKKYLKMARKLGDVGSVFWLPQNIPTSTYASYPDPAEFMKLTIPSWERYVAMDDEEIFTHLRSISVGVRDYRQQVQRLILRQLHGCPYLNLCNDHEELLEDSDQLHLLLQALGGSDIPVTLVRGLRHPHRRWNDDGNINTVDASTFGISSYLIDIISDDVRLDRAAERLAVEEKIDTNNITTWSLNSGSNDQSSKLSAQTSTNLHHLALKVLAFARPPCFEGNTQWTRELKPMIWKILQQSIENKQVPLALREQIVEVCLFFAERDSFMIRCLALDRARALVRKSMPYHLHASIALFQSIVCRQDGDLEKSNAAINDFVIQGFRPVTRLDHGVLGRLHISHVETKIQQYDDDVGSMLYNWQGKHPLSKLETEVTRRLQVLASKFLLSIGDFEAAKASLEHYLALNLSEPQRTNTHRLVVGRLAETYSELHDFDRAIQTVEPHLEKLDESRKIGRPDRRLRLALIEANIEKGIFDHSGAILAEIAASEPSDRDDVVEQLLTIRRLIAEARTVHLQCHYDKALDCWKHIQVLIDQYQQFKSRYYFVLAVVHVSIAHARLNLDKIEDAEQSWSEAIGILKTNRCEFCLPGFATLWLRKLVKEIHQSRGWLFRMMLPGGRPDFTWPPGITV